MRLGVITFCGVQMRLSESSHESHPPEYAATRKEMGSPVQDVILQDALYSKSFELIV
jgi:hypothetical protein